MVGACGQSEFISWWLSHALIEPQEHIRPQVHTEYATNIDREIHVYHE